MNNYIIIYKYSVKLPLISSILSKNLNTSSYNAISMKFGSNTELKVVPYTNRTLAHKSNTPSNKISPATQSDDGIGLGEVILGAVVLDALLD